MDALLILVTALMVLTKFFDCWTTNRAITHPLQEQNPMARWLMEKLGTAVGIWGIFFLSVIIVGLSLVIVLGPLNFLVCQISYLMIGSVVAMLQGAVAISNFTGKYNPFTRVIQRLFGRLNSWARRYKNYTYR